MPWTKVSDKTLATVIRWAYITIVICATITMVILIRENQQLVEQINDSRKAITYDACLEQNAKNKELIIFLEEIALQQQRREAKNSGRPLDIEPPKVDPVARKFVNVLAPVQNCELLVINRFGSSVGGE